jgi:hypothetical protein
VRRGDEVDGWVNGWVAGELGGWVNGWVAGELGDSMCLRQCGGQVGVCVSVCGWVCDTLSCLLCHRSARLIPCTHLPLPQVRLSSFGSAK